MKEQDKIPSGRPSGWWVRAEDAEAKENALKAENERLRKALDDAIDSLNVIEETTDENETSIRAGRAIAAAREALNPQNRL